MAKIILNTIYKKLHATYGPQYWWPGDSSFEVIVGAILTQNTNWSNVEQALNILKHKGLLDSKKLYELSLHELAALIKPAGYYNIKAKRLHNFLDLLVGQYNGNLKQMGDQPLEILRPELLAVNGIGPETADSILLYAFNKPIFVIDTYTKRILYRHNLIPGNMDYEGMQKLFMEHLTQDVNVFNEYHALIVQVGKNYCKPQPRCDYCPLNCIQYSMTYRCAACHRYLGDDLSRHVTENGYLCRECHLSE